MEKETRRGLLIGLFLIIGFGVVLSELDTSPKPENNDSAEAYLGKYYHVQDVIRNDGRSGNRQVVIPGRQTITSNGADRRSSRLRSRATTRRGIIDPSMRATINRGRTNRETRVRRRGSDAISRNTSQSRTQPSESQNRTDRVVRSRRNSSQQRIYKVKRGDGLYVIAQKVYGSGNGRFWKKIAAANRAKLGSRNVVRVGQKLVIPPLNNQRPSRETQISASDIARRVNESTRTEPMYKYYVVKRRDNLTRIARDKLNDSSRAAVRKLYNANRDKLRSINSPLRVGMKLKIPS